MLTTLVLAIYAFCMFDFLFLVFTFFVNQTKGSTTPACPNFSAIAHNAISKTIFKILMFVIVCSSARTSFIATDADLLTCHV